MPGCFKLALRWQLPDRLTCVFKQVNLRSCPDGQWLPLKGGVGGFEEKRSLGFQWPGFSLTRYLLSKLPEVLDPRQFRCERRELSLTIGVEECGSCRFGRQETSALL